MTASTGEGRLVPWLGPAWAALAIALALAACARHRNAPLEAAWDHNVSFPDDWFVGVLTPAPGVLPDVHLGAIPGGVHVEAAGDDADFTSADGAALTEWVAARLGGDPEVPVVLTVDLGVDFAFVRAVILGLDRAGRREIRFGAIPP